MGRSTQPKANSGAPWRLDRFKEHQQLLENADSLLRLTTLAEVRTAAEASEFQRQLSGYIQKTSFLEAKLSKKIKKFKNQAASTALDRDGQDSIGTFTKWLKEQGAEMHGCSIAPFEGYGLGIKVDKDIQENSLVMSVPLKMCMSTDTAKNSVLKDFIQNVDLLRNMPNVLLTIHLLAEKFSGNSFWKPYIDMLPKSYTTILYFSQAELDELTGSCAVEPCYKQIRSIVRQYAYFYKLFSILEDEVGELMKGRFSFKEYCWAVSTVMSRQNMVPTGGADTPNMTVLIPLFDMCNHANGRITTDYNTELQRTECSAFRDFRAGEQLFIFYGARTNSEFLCNNGFFYEDNEHDYRLVSLSTPVPKRVELLRKMELPHTLMIKITRNIRNISKQLLAFVRVMCLPADQLNQWMSPEKASTLADSDCPLDALFNKKCWDYLKIRISLALAEFKTTIEEDLEILKKPNLSENMKMIVRLRLNEKELLKGFSMLVEEMSRK